MNRKRVLVVTLEYPPERGGVADYVAGFIKSLDADTMCVVHGTGINDEVHYTSLLSKFFWPRWLQGVFKLRNIIKKRGPFDVVVISHVLPVGSIVTWARALAGSKAKLVTICHGLDVERPLYTSRWKKFLIGRILKKSDLVVTNSTYTSGVVQKYGIHETGIAIVRPGLRTIPPPPVVARGLPLLILSVGRLVGRKGFDTMMMALPGIVKQLQSVKYVIAGTGPDMKRLKKLAFSLGMDRYVWFAGDVTEERKQALYASAHIFAMPSRSINGDVEGFGKVFLEAASCGVPSIGSFEGGVPEAIEDGHSGVLVEPSNTERLSEVVIALLEQQPMREAMGQYAYERVVRDFTFESTIAPVNEWLSSF